ncbi:MAG TPA: DUF433 domain-containing protein [Bryobacteraceae bacterium]|jgi:uncharacterized protein (DUF433 family)|nr:DUF433 domain-containing protein [Bryobacteraceae bacterium]
MDWSNYPGVEQVEGRLGGKPVLKNSRVPAELIAECLDAGETPQEIAYNYTLKLQDVLNFKAFKDAQQPALPR